VLEVRDLADQGAEDSDMTKKSKFKKRVRTQMEETGDRYTDAAEAIKGAEADKKVPVAMLDLIAAREDGALAVSEVLRKFHEEHHARGEWRATFGSHAIEHLWPGDGQPPKTEKLRKLLTDYQTDQTIGTSGVRQRSERHQKTVQQEYARMAKAVADKWPRALLHRIPIPLSQLSHGGAFADSPAPGDRVHQRSGGQRGRTSVANFCGRPLVRHFVGARRRKPLPKVFNGPRYVGRAAGHPPQSERSGSELEEGKSMSRTDYDPDEPVRTEGQEPEGKWSKPLRIRPASGTRSITYTLNPHCHACGQPLPKKKQ